MVDKNLDMIRKICAPNSTNEEFQEFIYLANQYNLDPLKKEIYFIKYATGKKPSIFTSRDGYLKIAQSHPNFDGMEGDAVYVGDKLTKRNDGSFLLEYGDAHMEFDKTQLRGAYCNVFRKDISKSVSIFVSFKDYNKGRDIWLSYPNAMILKVAESMALKRAFAISGIGTSEELGHEEEEVNLSKELLKEPILSEPETTEYLLPHEIAEIEAELVGFPKIAESILNKLPAKTFAAIKRNDYRAAKDRIRAIVAAESKVKPPEL